MGKGSKLLGVTAAAYNLMPPDVRDKKLADPRVDLELSRAVGRYVLGDGGGSRLLADKNIPKAFVDWVRLPTSGDAMKDYKGWEAALKKSFGERKFIKLDLTAEMVYNKLDRRK